MHGIRIALVAAACACGVMSTSAASQVGRRAQARIDQALRREGDALVELAKAALAGRQVPADFALEWSNDYFKAQPGTFVPFTITFTAPATSSRRALLYVRVEPSSGRQAGRSG